MTGEEARGGGGVEELAGELGDLELGGADVGDELVGLEDGGELVHPVFDGEDGDGEDDDVGGEEDEVVVGLGGALAEGVGLDGDAGLGDGFAVECGEVLLAVGVDAVDVAFVAGGSQGEADGGADEAGADDGDAFDHDA